MHLHEISYEIGLIIEYIYVNYTRLKPIISATAAVTVTTHLFKRFILTKPPGFSPI